MKTHIRHSKIFYYLCTKNEYVTAQQLSKYLNVSVRTIKTEINNMKDIFSRDGCHVESKRGLGYTLIVDDETKFSAAKNEIINHIKYSHANSNTANYVISSIVKNYLFDESGFEPFEIIEELFISLESLNKNMSKIVQQLKTFNVELEFNKKTKRYRVVGKEIDLRLLAKDYIIMYVDEIIANSFDFDDYKWTSRTFDFYKILDTVIKAISKLDISFFEVGVFRIACYIYIMCHRTNYNIDIDPNFIRNYISSIDFKITDDIISEFRKSYPQIEINETERDAIALNILSERDYSKYDVDNKLISNDFYHVTNSLYEAIISNEALHFLIIFPKDRIITWMLSISAKMLSYNYRQDKPYTFFNGQSVSYSLFSKFIAQLIVSVIKKNYSIDLNIYCFSYLTNCIYSNFMQIEFPAEKITVGIYSFLGKLTARTIREVILKSNLSYYIHDVYVFELYKDPSTYNCDLLLIHQHNENSLSISPSTRTAYFDGSNFVDSNIIYNIKAAYLSTSNYQVHLNVLNNLCVIQYHSPVTYLNVLKHYETYDIIEKSNQILSNFNNSSAFIFVKEKNNKIFDIIENKFIHKNQKFKRLFIISIDLTSKDLIYYKTMEAFVQILSRYGYSIDFSNKKDTIQFLKQEIEKYLVETLL